MRPASPRKKTNRSKRRTDSDAAVVSHKRSKTDFTDDILASQLDGASAPRRTSRSGAGSGGRTSQMQKIEAALETQARKQRSATDLPEDVVENPIAPERRRKGEREKRPASHVFHSKDELTHSIVQPPTGICTSGHRLYQSTVAFFPSTHRGFPTLRIPRSCFSGLSCCPFKTDYWWT